MTPLVKGIVGVVGATSGIGLVALGVHKFSPSEELKTISSLLTSKNKDKRKLVKSSSGSEDGWQKSGKAYREAFNNSDKNPFSLTGTKGVASENATQEFMSACEMQESKKVKDIESEDYQLFLKYCTRNTLMSDLVKENPKRQALAKENSDSSAAAGKVAWKAYKGENKDTTDKRDHWQLDGGNSKNSQDNAPVVFMERCDKELNRVYYDTSEDDYKKVISGCTEEIKNG